jgi:hypothetical protein
MSANASADMRRTRPGADGYEVSCQLMSTGQVWAAVSGDQVCRVNLPVLTG